MSLTFILFFIGFYILVKGANFLVDGSSSIARKFHVSSFVIGLAIVGIGTSIPEFAVSFIANLTNQNDIGLGTIIGSNTFNILFILGISALFFPLALKKEWVERDLMWNIIAVSIPAVLAVPLLLGDGKISRPEGLLMLILFLYWLYIVIMESNSAKETEETGIKIREIAFPLAIGLIAAGLVGVVLGGKWIVDGAVAIAREFGMSESLIGLTIVGMGTSFPEFAASFVAARKKQPGIAVGNIIGSNIFDFLMILGFAGLVKPIIFSSHLFLDLGVTILSAILLYRAMFVGKKYVLKRWQGAAFVLFYFVYMGYLIWRG